MSGEIRRYAIVVEKCGMNYSACAPDLPGCVATGVTVAETEQEMREAISFHIQGMIEDGLVVPDSSSIVDYPDVAAA